MGYYVKNRVLVTAGAAVTLPVGDSTDRPEMPVEGQIRFNRETKSLEIFSGTEYKKMSASGDFCYEVDDFDGDGSTTDFQMCKHCIDPTQLIVFVGSIYQTPLVHYTVNGTHMIMFPSAPPDGTIINVIHSSN